MDIALRLPALAPTLPAEMARDRLRALLPAGVTLTELRIEGDGYRLRVAAADNASVSRLLRAIDTAAAFSEPELLSIEAMADGRRDALIVMRQRGPGG
jgi:Tfp pilus assembly protein PilN